MDIRKRSQTVVSPDGSPQVATLAVSRTETGLTRSGTSNSSLVRMATVGSLGRPRVEVPQLGELGPVAVVVGAGEDEDTDHAEQEARRGLWDKLKGEAAKPEAGSVTEQQTPQLTLGDGGPNFASAAAQSGIQKMKGALGWGAAAMTKLGAIAMHARMGALAEKVSQLEFENSGLKDDNAELKERYEGEKRRAEDLLDVCMKSGLAAQTDWASRQRQRRGEASGDDTSAKKSAKAVVDMKIQLQNEQRAMRAKLQRFEAVEGALREMESLAVLNIEEIRQDMDFCRSQVSAMQIAWPKLAGNITQCVQGFAKSEEEKELRKAPRSVHTQYETSNDEMGDLRNEIREKEALIQGLESDVRRITSELEQRERRLKQITEENASLHSRLTDRKNAPGPVEKTVRVEQAPSPAVEYIEVPAEQKPQTLEDLLAGIEEFAKNLTGARRDEILGLLHGLKKVQEDIAVANDISLPLEKETKKPVSSQGSKRERTKYKEFEVQRSERHVLLDLYPDVVDRMQKAEEERKKRWAAKVADFKATRAAQLEKLLFLLTDEAASMTTALQPPNRYQAAQQRQVNTLQAYIRQLTQWREAFSRENSPKRGPPLRNPPLSCLKIDQQRGSPQETPLSPPAISRFAVASPQGRMHPHRSFSPGVASLLGVSSPKSPLSPGLATATGHTSPTTPKLPNLNFGQGPVDGRSAGGSALIKDQQYGRGKRPLLRP